MYQYRSSYPNETNYGYFYRQPYPNELYHYGILGQHWGVRRYQNEDGSLTSEGKKRYSETVASRSKGVNTSDSQGNIFSLGKYRYPNWSSRKHNESVGDRFKEWLTGDKHETLLSEINSNISNMETVNENLGHVSYEYMARNYSQEDIDAMDPSRRELLSKWKNYTAVGESVANDYLKHTLPGIIDSIILKGKALINRIFNRKK